MDGGKEFFAQTFDIFVYKEPTILHQSPAVIDMRDKLIPSISLVTSLTFDLKHYLILFYPRKCKAPETLPKVCE